MKVIYTMEAPDTNTTSVFLAGPTMRISDDFDGMESSWRNEAVQYFQKLGFDGNIFIPEFRENKKPNGWTYGKQVDWEVENLNGADVILFWIPRDLEKLPAFTTNIEFGEWMKSGKISIGAPDKAPKNDYIKYRCEKLNIPFFNNLKEVVAFAILKIKMNK
jgi:hypothetical protein